VKRAALKRTAFRRSRKEGPTVEREQHPRALVATVRPLVRGTYAGGTSGIAVAKEPATKPGKRTPSKEERAWMDAIVAYGCIACRMDGLGVVPPAVHHMLRGGQRIGHLHTLPLCDPGHHQNGQQFGKVSRHPWKAQFEQRYGSEDHLLAMLRAELGETP
jgi:hypothetical protein